MEQENNRRHRVSHAINYCVSNQNTITIFFCLKANIFLTKFVDEIKYKILRLFSCLLDYFPPTMTNYRTLFRFTTETKLIYSVPTDMSSIAVNCWWVFFNLARTSKETHRRSKGNCVSFLILLNTVEEYVTND